MGVCGYLRVCVGVCVCACVRVCVCASEGIWSYENLSYLKMQNGIKRKEKLLMTH